MSEKRRRPFGINIHIDAYRPWLSGDKLERNIPAIASRGFDHIRVVGDPVLVSDDGSEVSDPQRIVERLVQQCREHSLTALPLSWNVISDTLAAQFPLVDAAGRTYPRGHWGLFNFSHPRLRETSIRALESTLLELRKYPDVFPSFQPTLEWQLVSYPPHGWAWQAYAGEMKRAEPKQVMYDVDSLAQWSKFLQNLPDTWQAAVVDEHGGARLNEILPPDISIAPGFSAHRLAWAAFRSSLFGDYFADVYRRLKPHAGDMQLLVPEAMPLPLIDSGLELASLGHNPEAWLRRGELGDMLTVSVYDSVFEITAYPGHADSALEQPAAMMYFAELARSYNLPLAVTEQGANSYHHTEDGQRYLAMRGALAAAAFDIESHSHLLWNDEPSFEGVHEQFYGTARDQHLQLKPTAHEIARVAWLIRHADTSLRRPDPQVMIVVPRESMDVGLEGWTCDALAGQWLQVSGVSTSSLVADRGLPASVRTVVFSGLHAVGSSAMFERAREVDATIVVYADAAPFGVDEAATRAGALRELTGLKRRPAAMEFDAVDVEWAGAQDHSTGTRQAHLGLGVDIRLGDLPEDAVVISSVRGTDRVLAYEHAGAVLSAIPIGRPYDEIQSDLSQWTRTLLHSALDDRIDLRFEILDGADLTYHLIGDILTVTNGRPSRATARVSFNSGADVASIDVAPGHFSAIQLATQPTVALLSGTGRVVINGSVVLQSDAHVAAMLADRDLRVEPLHDRSGRYLTGMAANGIPASMQSEHGIDVWTVPNVGTSAEIRTTTIGVIESQAVFRSRMAVRPAPATSSEPRRALSFVPRAVEDRAARHTLLDAPTRAWLEWEVAEGTGTPLRCEYSWWSGTGARRDTFECELAGTSGRIAVPVPTEYPALVRCVLMPPDSADTTVNLVYEAEDVLDTLTSRIGDGVLRSRLLHPMRREGFDVVEASATILEEAVPRKAKLVVGHRGMHTRHLQWSEDWIDFYG